MSAVGGRQAAVPGVAGLAGRGAWLVLAFVLPVLMVYANRSSPLWVALAAVLAAVASGPRPARFAALLRTPEAAAAGAGLAWALASCAWSVDPAGSLRALGELAVSAGAAVACAVLLPRPAPAWLARALAAGILLACVLALVELRLDLPVRRLLGGRDALYVMNRPVVVLLLLAWPFVALMRARGREAAGLAILVPVGLVAGLSESASAVLAAAASVLVYAVARAAPRLAAAGAALAVVAVMASAPVFGDALARLVPGEVHAQLRKTASSEVRILIWRAFGEVARLRPLTGTGFASSPRLADDPVAAEIDPALRRVLPIGHPHDAFLQVWTETGLPGALAVTALLLLAVRRISRAPPVRAPAGFALLAAAAAVALVSHGAWQGWWIAAVGAAAVLMTAAEPRPPSGEAHYDP